jgi:hypothetical protein
MEERKRGGERCGDRLDLRHNTLVRSFHWLCGRRSSRSGQCRGDGSSPKVLDSANPPYEPETIVAQAERDFTVEDYNGTLQAIRELEENDRRRPDVQALFAKSSDASVKESMASYRKARLDYADDYEKSMLLAGQNMTIRAEGKDAQILTITYVLTNRSYVYILMNDRALNSKWMDMGFKTIRLSDGYEYSWSFKPSI